MSRILIQRTLDDVIRNHRGGTVYYAMRTCWWGMKTYRCERHSLPCGPRGECLMMSDDVAAFILRARENPEHYGRHGIAAFEAALDGNVIDCNGRPWSLESWEQYNALIDLEIDRALGGTWAYA